MILLDTNLLLRLTSSAGPQSAHARLSIQKLLSRGERLIIVPQNLYEFWSVATRQPGAPPRGLNGLGFEPAQASQWLSFFLRRFTLLPDRQELPAAWHALVKQHGIRGARSHDARLVAAMNCYAIMRLLTFNRTDFGIFDIEVLDPDRISQE